MDFNKYMHDRNVFKSRKPNFAQLAQKYSNFKQHCIESENGSIRLDFKNSSSVRVLTVVLLKEYFDLDVDLPLDRLIPAIPLRVNYILWLEDILNGEQSETILDVGAGSSCIYGLLGAKKNNWKMVAAEIDEKNFLFAEKNTNTRSESRKEPWSINTANSVEGVIEGGEVEFIRRIIDQSIEIGQQIRVYTTMLGKKSSLTPLKQHLAQVGVRNVGTTEFCQGRTMRWGLAWSFDATVVFPVNKRPKPSSNKPLTYMVPRGITSSAYSTQAIFAYIQELLDKAKIPFETCGEILEIAPIENTWSHSRRKRREDKRLSSSPMRNAVATVAEDKRLSSSPMRNAVATIAMTTEENGFHTPDAGNAKKRPMADDDVLPGDEGVAVKRARLCADESPMVEPMEGLFSPEIDHKPVLFKCHLDVNETSDDGDVEISMHWIEGQSKEYMHQVLQHLKNNLK